MGIWGAKVRDDNKCTMSYTYMYHTVTLCVEQKEIEVVIDRNPCLIAFKQSFISSFCALTF